MTALDAAYRQLGEAEAIRLHGSVTGRHPAGYPLQGLLRLQAAVERYGRLIRNRERVDFATWAERIEADAVAGIDDDRGAIVDALRAMHRAAHGESKVISLLDRLRPCRLRPVATPENPRR